MNRDLALQILAELLNRVPANTSEKFAAQSAINFLDEATKPVEKKAKPGTKTTAAKV